MIRSLRYLRLCVAVCLLPLVVRATPSLLENLGRGVVALRTDSTTTFVSWRVLGTDAAATTFNVYRTIGTGAPVLITPAPITAGTNLTDTPPDFTQPITYAVAPIVGGTEQPATSRFTLPADAPITTYLSIPLTPPDAGTTASGDYSYVANDNAASDTDGGANDTSVADLDGDGEYELIVKWSPTNSKDNSQSGYTGNTYLDAYTLAGTRLWRIDLGINIRSGAHYTQFLAYDFDGDGKAEIVCKTAPGTRDGTGAFIAQAGKFIGTPSAVIDHNADYRNSDGYILTGPEFFTIFNGLTGAELATTNYVVPRNSDPASADVNAWGDNYGNRVDRFLACVAYLDGSRPSIVLCRGYYTRAVLAAWDWRGGQLTQRWVFDTGHSGTASPYATWRGQGAHSVSVGDVDGDGRDEILYGAAAIDDNGAGLYSTTLGHGDATHMSDMDPSRPGQEVWMAHEDPGSYGSYGLDLRDARTGQIILGIGGGNTDVGRGCAGDIDPRYAGYELWGARGSLINVSGTVISSTKPAMNFMCWWDGDLLREVLDHKTISKWDWTTNTLTTLLSPAGVTSNNSTKATPNLSGDILGDWREEVVWRTPDSSELRIYSTTIPTTHRLPTLMHDRQYRLAIAWQNVGYNQPPHPSYFIGDGMAAAPTAAMVTSLADLPATAPAVVSIDRYDPFTASTGATSLTFRVTFNTGVTGVDVSDFTLTTAGLTASIASVSAVSPVAYDVVVSPVTGTGTVRLDLNASGTGITALDTTPIAVGFNTGAVYNRSTLAWTQTSSGGLWSQSANWDGGVVGTGTGSVLNFTNLDLTSTLSVVVDAPQSAGQLNFADTATATPGSWLITNNGIVDNTLTLDTTSGAAVLNVAALGTGSVATLDVPLIGNDGLSKTGAGTLVLTQPNSLTGSVNVSGGTLRVGPGGALASTASSTISGSGSILNVAGGTFSSTGLITVNNGNSLVVDSGTATLTGGVRTNNTDGAIIKFTGGASTVGAITVQRSFATGTPSYSTGVIVAGGTVDATSVLIGSNNSNGTLSIEGGTLSSSGTVIIGNQATGGRGGHLRVTSGGLNVANTAYGLVLSRKNGTNANNVVTATFSGGTSSVEKLTLGYDDTVTAGSATVTLSGGTLYLGSGGIVKNGTSGLTTTINLNSGTLGAKANWATAVPVALGGNVTFRAADAAGTAFNIALNGALTGTGGFTKTGAGTLTLGASSSASGNVTISEGTLSVTAPLTSTSGTLTVAAGATVAGSSTIARPVTLAGTAAPTGTLTAASLEWQAGGRLASRLGSTADQLAITGALTRTGTGNFTIALSTGTGFTSGAYTVATFGSTNLTAADLSLELPAAYTGSVAVQANAITVTINNAFGAWATANGLPAGQQGVAHDPDGDGLPNALEFALGLNPSAPGGTVSSVTTVTVGGVQYPALRYNRRRALGDVTVAVQAALSPAFPTDLGTIEVSATDLGNGLDEVVARSAVPLSTQPVQFLRVLATSL